MSKAENAAELFKTYNCAQSVFAGCGPHEGLSNEACLAIAGPFGGGVGRMGEMCGAFTGALMALGMRSGREMATNPAEARGPVYAQVTDFADKFKQRNGSLLCREITGCDLGTAEGQARAKELNVHQEICRGVVMNAVEMVEARK